MITEAQQSVVEPDETTESDTDSGAESVTDSDTDRDTDGTSSGDKRIMTELQSACLSFCIELLNQRIHNHEYDIADWRRWESVRAATDSEGQTRIHRYCRQ